jgi:hypothetical protein
VKLQFYIFHNATFIFISLIENLVFTGGVEDANYTGRKLGEEYEK